MKVKICNLLRATTYLELLVATLVMGCFTYDAFLHLDLNSGTIFFLTIIIAAALQAVYSIAVVRLIHYYGPSQRIPDRSFLHFYKLLVSLNMMVGIGLIIWLAVQFTMLIQQLNQYGIYNAQLALQLCIVGCYAVVSTYTIAGAAKLKRAILQRREWQLETWLEEVGHAAAA